MPRKAAIPLVLLTGLSAALAGQRSAPPMASWTPLVPGQPDPPPSLFPPAPDYRWEGLAIGGLAGGIFVAYGATQVCNDSDNGGSGNCALATVVGFGVGAVVGGVAGGLIGGLIPKDSPASGGGN